MSDGELRGLAERNLGDPAVERVLTCLANADEGRPEPSLQEAAVVEATRLLV